MIDIMEYEKQQATLKLMSKLVEAEAVVKSEDDWLDFAELKNVYLFIEY